MRIPISLPPGAQYVEGPPGPAGAGGIDARDFGTTGLGAADDSSALTAGLAEAAGKVLVIPEGTYRFDSRLAIPANTKVCLSAGATLQCRVADGGPGITLGNAARLYGEGVGADTAQIHAHATSNISSLITNLSHDGTQEYAFVEGLFLQANSGAVVATAMVNFVSLFLNSAIRHCVIACNDVAPTGLRIAGGTTVGCGPVVAEDIWVTRGTSHNIIVTEDPSTPGDCKVWLTDISSEHQASGFHALFLEGFGSLAHVKVRNFHHENGKTASAPTAAIYATFVPGLVLDGIEVEASPTANKKGIVLDNCHRAQVWNVHNQNVVDPILEDAQHGVTIAGTHIGFYESANPAAGSPEQRFVHPVRFDAGLTALGSSYSLGASGQTVRIRADATNERSIAMSQSSGSNVYAFTHPVGSGNEMRIRYIDGGIDIVRFRTNGAFVHQSTLLGFYGATAVTKPTVTGSRGANAALASLLTALASQGLITDGSSA